VEIEAWDVPKWQKEMVRRCNQESKPVIVATQMLESMCENSRPTRAEASDVYNAVIDGADAVMLSGESSVGKYPIESVNCMNEIVRVAQGNMPHRNPQDFDSKHQAITETLCHAACAIGTEFQELNFKGKYIVLTESGRGARLLSKYRPSMPILAFSESIRVVRELAMVWGVRAHHVKELAELPLEERAMKAIEIARAIGYLDTEDKKVCVVTPSQFKGTGFFTGVYDVDALELHRKAMVANKTAKKGSRASMI
jgi:pyruvate kinase